MRADHEKRGVLLLAVAALVGVALLAAALNGFTFASPYAPSEQPGEGFVDQADSAVLMRVMAFFTLCLLPLVAVALLLASRRRKWLLLLLLLGFVIIFALTLSRPTQVQSTPTPAALGTAPVEQASLMIPEPTLAPPPEIGEPQVTSGLIWLLSLGTAGLLVGLILLAWRVWQNFRGEQASPLQAIAASAETALQALERGADWQSTVLGCYQSMLAAAEQSRGVERPEHMTPAEFILRLVQAGLPQASVERLTHLFEKVRYSPQSPSAAMEAEAIACLQDVVTAAKGEI